MKFSIGDCVILNDCDRPSDDLVAVVVSDYSTNGHYYKVAYLNADKRLDQYQDIKATLSLATKIEDFGVELVDLDDVYYCPSMRESKAKYPDGEPRKWQEKYPVKHRYRPELMKIIREKAEVGE